MTRSLLLTALLLLAACGSTRFSVAETPDDPSLYAALYPYYIETCAVSAMKKEHGFGFEYEGGAGGHAVVYLNGVCRDTDSASPAVHLCDGAEAEDGVGLSANAHFSNARWVATPGRAFFFDGDLHPGEGVTLTSYARTQQRAKQLGLLKGIRFHDDVFDDMPAGISRNDFMYEASVGTDYGISLGRGRFCARLPVNKLQMTHVVTYLNKLNAQFRDGHAVSSMTVVESNCSHFTHNVNAAAGLWSDWPTDQPVLTAALSFPVPKNEFVNEMRRSNDLPLDDPALLWHDTAARLALMREQYLPTGPGAIATAAPPRTPNALYDPAVNLIFYDMSFVGSYQRHFDAIVSQARYTDLTDNLNHFLELYARIQADHRPAGWWVAHAALSANEALPFQAFYQRYTAYIDRMYAQTRIALATLRHDAPLLVAQQPLAGRRYAGSLRVQ